MKMLIWFALVEGQDDSRATCLELPLSRDRVVERD
jgi:hypothetical protein